MLVRNGKSVVAARALPEGEQRYRSLFQNSAVALIEEDHSAEKSYLEELRARGVKDLRKHFDAFPEEVRRCVGMVKVLGVNRKFLELFGIAGEKEPAGGIDRFFTDETYAAYKEELIGIWNGKLPHESEMNVRHASGKTLAVLVNWSVFPGYESTLERVNISLIDITERTRAEQALRQAERRYRDIFENAVEGMFQASPDGHFLTANRAMARMFGYSSPEELIREVQSIGQQLYVKPELREELKTRLEGQAEVRDFEVEFYRKDGSTLWVSSSTRAVCDEEGKTLYYEGTCEDITERKRAQDALQLTQFAVDHAPIGMLWVNEEGRFVYVNDHACRALGYTREEMLGFHVWDIDQDFSLEKRPAFLKIMRRVGSLTTESTHRRKDGSVFPIELLVTYLNFQGKEYDFAFARDITERKRAEEEVRSSRQMLQMVLDNFPGAVFWKDVHSVYLGCNRALAVGAGVDSPPGIAGKTDYDLPWGNTMADLYCQHDREVLEGGKPKLGIIEQQEQADGRIRWFETNKVPLRDAEGTVIGVLGVANDITERKHMEDALRASEQEYRSIFENQLSGIAVTDAEGVFTKVNPAFCRILGYPEAELVGCKAVWDVTHPDDIVPSREGIQRLVRREVTSFTIEKRYLAKSRRVVHALGYAYGLYDEQGKYVGSTASVIDISERKAMEQALRMREHDLEIKTSNLEEANTALKVLLKAREEDKMELEEKVLQNIKDLVVPFLEKLEKSGATEKQHAYIDIIKSNLDEVIAPFSRSLSSRYFNFTPSELQVANLVRQGKTTKEIAEALNSSRRVVEFHRNNIRKKLGLKSRRMNLRSRLLSIA